MPTCIFTSACHMYMYKCRWSPWCLFEYNLHIKAWIKFVSTREIVQKAAYTCFVAIISEWVSNCMYVHPDDVKQGCCPNICRCLHVQQFQCVIIRSHRKWETCMYIVCVSLSFTWTSVIYRLNLSMGSLSPVLNLQIPFEQTSYGHTCTLGQFTVQKKRWPCFFRPL